VPLYVELTLESDVQQSDNVVSPPLKNENGHDRESRTYERKNDAPENAEVARTIDAGRVDELIRSPPA
jgi:hypothetical protein